MPITLAAPVKITTAASNANERRHRERKLRTRLLRRCKRPVSREEPVLTLTPALIGSISTYFARIRAPFEGAIRRALIQLHDASGAVELGIMTSDEGLLDEPVWASLTGAHTELAERKGGAARYPAEVAPFAALADAADPNCWLDLAELFGSRAVAVLPGVSRAPDDWEIVDVIDGVQLVGTMLRAEIDDEAVRLDHADVPEMLELIARTRPGPFLPRTIELGDYAGIRRGGALIAMAGERLHPLGWTEISAVCTDAAYRGQGLGTRLMRHVAAGISERGESPFLHAAATNVNAIRLYESIGFTHRREIRFLLVRTSATLSG